MSSPATVRAFRHESVGRAQRICVHRTEPGLPRAGWFFRSELGAHIWMPCPLGHPTGGAFDVPVDAPAAPEAALQ
jgi:hypothetical protein